MSRRVRTAGGLLPRFGRTAIALQALAAAAFVTALLVAVTPGSGSGWTLTVELPDAGGLGTNDRARVVVAGVRSGRVDDVVVRGRRAVVTLRLDPDTAGKVRRGATVSIRQRSALNDLEVALTPGAVGAPPLRDGDRVEPADRARPVALDEVLATLDGDTRAYVQVIAAALDRGLGVDSGDELAAVLHRVRPTVDAGARVADLLGPRRALLRRLVTDLDRLLDVTARNGESLSGAIGSARAVAGVAAARGPELERTIAALPATLGDLRTALGDIEDLGRPLQPALAELRPAARQLPAALRALRQTAPPVRALVSELRRLGRDARAPVRDLRRALSALPEAAGGLTSPVGRAGTVVDAIDRHRDGIGLLGERFSGIFSTNDANGPVLRGLGFFEPFDPANFGAPGATGARRAKVAADVVRALTRVCRRDNAVACLVRYRVPGLPGAVRTAKSPLGLTRQSRSAR